MLWNAVVPRDLHSIFLLPVKSFHQISPDFDIMLLIFGSRAPSRSLVSNDALVLCNPLLSEFVDLLHNSLRGCLHTFCICVFRLHEKISEFLHIFGPITRGGSRILGNCGSSAPRSLCNMFPICSLGLLVMTICLRLSRAA